MFDFYYLLQSDKALTIVVCLLDSSAVQAPSKTVPFDLRVMTADGYSGRLQRRIISTARLGRLDFLVSGMF